MDAELKKQRRLAATKARRNIFKETVHPKSYFELMTDSEREAFFARERKRSATALKQRKVKKTILTGIGLLIAASISLLALVPIFFTFLNSFMSSEEIVSNYQVVFQSMSGHATQGATYMSRTPVLKLIPEEVTISQYTTLLFMNPEYLFKF
jgi:multiple sugar transport system permease protein